MSRRIGSAEFTAKFDLGDRVFFRKHETLDLERSRITGVIFNVTKGSDKAAYYQLSGEVTEYEEHELFFTLEEFNAGVVSLIEKELDALRKQLNYMEELYSELY